MFCNTCMRYFYLHLSYLSPVWTLVFFILILGLFFALYMYYIYRVLFGSIMCIDLCFCNSWLKIKPKSSKLVMPLSCHMYHIQMSRSLFVDCRLQRVMVTMATAYPSLTFTSLTLTCTPSCLGNQTSTWPQCSPVHGPCRPHDWPSTQQVSLIVIVQLSSLDIQFDTKEG